MLILVTGKNGQVGSSLQALAKGPLADTHEFEFVGRDEVDLAEPGSAAARINDLEPDIVINAAAYTAVDKAESEPDVAARVNADASGEIADACAATGAALLHYSTDYVFDGTATTPYREMDTPSPLGVYGRTKLEGEKQVAAKLDRHIVVRTSWVYDADGKNFLNTMLRLAGEHPELRVVGDQIGGPTLADDLAASSVALMEAVLAREERDDDAPWGVYHASGQGKTSWHGFASKIFELSEIDIPVHAITTADYPTPAPRPAYSVLDNGRMERMGVTMAPWEDALARCIAAKS